MGALIPESLRVRSSDLNVEAARAGGELELSEARPALFDLLQAEDGETRLAAAWALSQIGGQGVSAALQELLERTEDEDEMDLIENALENLAFTDEIGKLDLLDLSPEDLDELAHPDHEESQGPSYS